MKIPVRIILVLLFGACASWSTYLDYLMIAAAVEMRVPLDFELRFVWVLGFNLILTYSAWHMAFVNLRAVADCLLFPTFPDVILAEMTRRRNRRHVEAMDAKYGMTPEVKAKLYPKETRS